MNIRLFNILLHTLVVCFGISILKGNLAYASDLGSSFNEVTSVLQDSTIDEADLSEEQLAEFSIYQQGYLPMHKSISFKNLLNPFKMSELIKDSIRTTSVRSDYLEYNAKKVHPNGICITGEWIINAQKTNYGGYFQTNSRGLFVGRISTGGDDTESGKQRSFGFAGKIFPTSDGDKKVRTANFFAVDKFIGSAESTKFLDVKLTNEPELFPDCSQYALLGQITYAFSRADSNPAFRPLTQISALGKSPQEKSTLENTRWIKISTSSKIKRNNSKDFRNEVSTAFETNGGQLEFDISVSNTTKDADVTDGWDRIGRIVVNKYYVSYGCDRRLHFSHPKMTDKE